ncbi:oligoendopeptidase F [Sporosarcina sp. P37]|uniref:oligoendopeptidase F n=1 Tax=unclassified Sporosarcina TaxID=2647733 RepID=UPI000A17B7D8|nr:MULTISPECIES: oligoendopeptidase F [unclassified Sporosarcina]ARK23832.1 oligoendopeptidase F [Sporosarcina sp. P37]PID17242.1 oligoendopeptidase F [Sporosarcina sp. P35]
MVKSLPKRTAVNEQETWNLNTLFEDERAYQQAVKDAESQAAAFSRDYKGTITDANSAIRALDAYRSLQEKLVKISSYAELAASVDLTDDAAQMRESQFGSIAAKIASQTSFVMSELTELSEETLKQASEQSDDYAALFEKIIREKPYQLHPEVEKTLAALSSSFQAPYSLYNTTKMADIRFPDFTADGKNYPLSYVSFEGKWESEPETAVRRAAFETFSDTLRNYQHTTAKTYDMHVQMEKTTADLRGYDSVIDYLLMEQDVDRSMYNRQIDVIMKDLAPHMRKYAKLLQKIYGLDEMTFADLKIPVDPSYEPSITVEESKQYMTGALSVMGEDYLDMVNRAYSERWIDFAQNEGKSTGAFCASPYGSGSFILISWTGSMEDVFVLAHELGHAGHFHHANEAQNLFNSESSLYFIEAPSTMNEMLMANHLLKNSNDPKFKRWVLSSIVSRTYYHNFVTHLLEAAFQRKVYELADAGGNVNASILNELKRGVLEEFWGDSITLNKGAELTWMRQPHYYMGLYPYTYSAGLTISTEMAKRVLHEGEPAVKDWIQALRAGGSKKPAELAKMAGIDITTEKPLRDTISYIGELIDQIEKLTEEIDAQ